MPRRRQEPQCICASDPPLWPQPLRPSSQVATEGTRYSLTAFILLLPHSFVAAAHPLHVGLERPAQQTGGSPPSRTSASPRPHRAQGVRARRGGTRSPSRGAAVRLSRCAGARVRAGKAERLILCCPNECSYLVRHGRVYLV